MASPRTATLTILARPLAAEGQVDHEVLRADRLGAGALGRRDRVVRPQLGVVPVRGRRRVVEQVGRRLPRHKVPHLDSAGGWVGG